MVDRQLNASCSRQRYLPMHPRGSQPNERGRASARAMQPAQPYCEPRLGVDVLAAKSDRTRLADARLHRPRLAPPGRLGFRRRRQGRLEAIPRDAYPPRGHCHPVGAGAAPAPLVAVRTVQPARKYGPCETNFGVLHHLLLTVDTRLPRDAVRFVELGARIHEMWWNRKYLVAGHARKENGARPLPLGNWMPARCGFLVT